MSVDLGQTRSPKGARWKIGSSLRVGGEIDDVVLKATSGA
jgi:hypothetical protein